MEMRSHAYAHLLVPSFTRARARERDAFVLLNIRRVTHKPEDEAPFMPRITHTSEIHCRRKGSRRASFKVKYNRVHGMEHLPEFRQTMIDEHRQLSEKRQVFKHELALEVQNEYLND